MTPPLDDEAVRLCRWLAGTVFPWDITRSLELALLKTFCLPSISGLLSRTGEFEQRPRKRYDDTGLMVAELLRHGPDSEVGLAVIQRMNRIHGAYGITNDDFLYVLSTFVAEPIRWLDRYGWRPLSRAEQEAVFRFWRHVGGLMGIQAIPSTLEGLLELNTAVEQQLFRPAASNRRVAEATLAMLLSDWPAALQPPLRKVLVAVVEPEVAPHLGWTPSADLLRQFVRSGLRLRSRVVNGWQCFVPPKRTRFYSESPTPSYGASFRLEQLGPPAMLERLSSPRWSGPQRRIGLTGAIAVGASRLPELLAELNLPVVDADALARGALDPGSPAAKVVLERYGEAVAAEGFSGHIPLVDPTALAKVVAADPGERRWLEQQIQPVVRRALEQELQALNQAPTVVLILPFLFEAGLEELCSEVWLVDGQEQQQLEWLMRHHHLSEAEARARISAQRPIGRKRERSDRVIPCQADGDALKAALISVLNMGLGVTDQPVQTSDA